MSTLTRHPAFPPVCPSRRVRRAILWATTLLLLLSPIRPARAGHWACATTGTMTQTDSGFLSGYGSYSWEYDYDLSGADTPSTQYIGFPYGLPGGNGFDTTSDVTNTFGDFGNPCTETTTASPVVTLTWVRDTSLPSDPPPKAVYLVIHALAEGIGSSILYPSDFPAFGGSAAPSAGPNSQTVNYTLDPTRGVDKVSEGYQVVERDGSSGTIKVSGAALSATCTGADAVETDCTALTRLVYSVSLYGGTVTAGSTGQSPTAGQPGTGAGGGGGGPGGGGPGGGPGGNSVAYFSGTGCPVSVDALAVDGNVAHAQLKINGALVEEYDDDDTTPLTASVPNVAYPGGHNQSSWLMSGKFDSTHFPDGSQVTVTLTVTDSGGNVYPTLSLSGPVYNKAVIYGNDSHYNGSLTEGIPAAQNAASSFTTSPATYSVTPPNYIAHDKDKDGITGIYTALPTYTVFYIWTHGNATNAAGMTYASFGDCYYAGPTGGESLTETPVRQAVKTKTASQPPYNFVFIDSCLTMAAGDMPGAFGIPPANIPSDQAYLGFNGVVTDDDYAALWSKTLLTNLSQGYSISQALANTKTSVGDPHSPDGTPVKAVIGGDGNATTSGVYKGMISPEKPSTVWFKFQ